jgi:hypothetical protein
MAMRPNQVEKALRQQNTRSNCEAWVTLPCIDFHRSLCMKLILAALLLLAQAAMAGPHGPVVMARSGTSASGQIGHIPFVVLRGNSDERAAAFGALCGREVVVFLGETLIPLINHSEAQSRDRLAELTVAQFHFPQRYERQLAAFLTGLEQALAPSDRILAPLGRAISVRDLELLQCFGDFASSGRIGFGNACSSFTVWGQMTTDAERMAGRNVDYRTIPGRFPFMIVAQQPSEPGRQATICDRMGRSSSRPAIEHSVAGARVRDAALREPFR